MAKKYKKDKYKIFPRDPQKTPRHEHCRGNCTRHSGGQYTPPHAQDRSASGDAGVARKV